MHDCIAFLAMQGAALYLFGLELYFLQCYTELSDCRRFTSVDAQGRETLPSASIHYRESATFRSYLAPTPSSSMRSLELPNSALL